MTLAELKIGQTATILNVGGEGGLRQHFLDMGVLPGVPVTLVKYAPMGDPMELRVHGYELTLRRADARKIEVRRTENGKRETENGKLIANPLASHRSSAHPLTDFRSQEPEHPGLGEGGHYHQEQEKARRETQGYLSTPSPYGDSTLSQGEKGNGKLCGRCTQSPNVAMGIATLTRHRLTSQSIFQGPHSPYITKREQRRR